MVASPNRPQWTGWALSNSCFGLFEDPGMEIRTILSSLNKTCHGTKHDDGSPSDYNGCGIVHEICASSRPDAPVSWSDGTAIYRNRLIQTGLRGIWSLDVPFRGAPSPDGVISNET